MYYIDKDGKAGRTNEFGIFVGLAVMAMLASLFALCASAGLFK